MENALTSIKWQAEAASLGPCVLFLAL